MRAGINSAILALFLAMLASRWRSYGLQSRRVWAVRLTSVSFTGPRAFSRRFFVSASSFFFLSAVAVAMALAFVSSRAFFAVAAVSAVSLAALISAATSVRSRRSARVGRMSTSVNTKVRVLNKTRRQLITCTNCAYGNKKKRTAEKLVDGCECVRGQFHEILWDFIDST